MASGIPVIASRIGGLPYTVTDGVTGLLCEPAIRLISLARLDGCSMIRTCVAGWGWPGRRRFEEEFVWEDVIERYFRPLLTSRPVGSNSV